MSDISKPWLTDQIRSTLFVNNTFSQCSSVAQSCLTLCDPMDCSTPGFPITNSQSLLRLMSIESVMPSNHLILCCPLLLLPSVFPSIRVFFNNSLLESIHSHLCMYLWILLYYNSSCNKNCKSYKA